MILDRYLVKQFIPFFFISLSMFMLIIVLIDLFMNLWRYLNYEVALSQILRVCLYYLPKSLSYSLPVSLLFATAYTLGSLYGRNELITVFASGIPFWRFCVPFLFIGIIASFFSFFFDDRVVIPTLKMKNELSEILLHQERTENNSDIVIRARNGSLIYSVDFLDTNTNSLNGIFIIEKDEDGHLVSLIRAHRAYWTGEYWEFVNAVIYEWKDSFFRVRNLEPTSAYTDPPDSFRRNLVNAEELQIKDAGLLVNDLRAAGLPVSTALSEYYHRFSFPTASFVVMILSISMGGRFKKNILLMTLLASLSAAVVFFVMEMISMIMSRLGYIPPVAGAWFPVFVFIAIGLLLLRSAKT
ncbi:MAG: LptF/LptG family permease [Treponema sp.]|jgi:lipopolysaccharide export system permease protein|nr:LptF/LptG family permease [Treponema sp.]